MTRTALGAAAVALFVAAANLRPAIAAVSPLVDRIQTDLDLSATGVALLTTIPTLAMGVCAPLAAVVGRRFGLRRGVLIGLVVIAVATAARVFGGSAWLQLTCAAAVGAGIAIAQTLLPAVVKTRFADRAGLVTGIYTAGLGLGGAVAAGVTAPLADAIGSWPGALASWAVLAVAGMAMWSASATSLGLDSGPAPVGTARTGAGATGAGQAGPVTKGLPWRSGVAWRITALSAANSALYYCELAWVVPLLHEDGQRAATGAGVLLTVMISIQVVAMLAVPALLGEGRDRRAGLALTTVLTAIGFAGLAAAPATVTWLWIAALGVGHGGLFTLVLTLPVVVSRDAAEAGRISAMAFFVGYACAALAPLLVGALRDATGDFHLAFGLLSALTAAMLLPIARLHKGGDERGRGDESTAGRRTASSPSL
ncbi:CynX/NimT family MFS transporter [Nonomuraea sp. NEAU-A123]|uniref:MFS transporter n=1 Tax=Nonomuraea sp. NEAU-A123 TaxID=2839649 RepID=UPI001BE44052|nr:MFS transporter [Nonomuraea sp. NEAU-A123]MBT2229326.1 MFS transporter [Nonomuraea sp. NEAU-A123]